MEPEQGPQSTFVQRCEDLEESLQSMCETLKSLGATGFHAGIAIDDTSIAVVTGFYADPHARTALYGIVPSHGASFVVTSWRQLMASIVGERRAAVRWDLLCHDVIRVEASFIGSVHEAYLDRWDPELDEVHCWTAGTRRGKDLQAIDPVDLMKYRPILVAVQPSGEYRLYRGRRARLHAGMEAKRPSSQPPDAIDSESKDPTDTPE